MYRDTITYQELANTNVPASGYLRECVAILASKSGASNVSSGRITGWNDHDKLTIELRVSFDSSAWTGRDFRRPISRTFRISRSFARRFGWWLTTGLKKSLCRHDWRWDAYVCDICHLTGEAFEDHSWRHLPRNIAVAA